MTEKREQVGLSYFSVLSTQSSVLLLFRRRLHAADVDLEHAHDEAVVLLFFDLQLSFDQDLIREIGNRLALGAMADDRVLHLRRLSEAAGEQARHQRELR